MLLYNKEVKMNMSNTYNTVIINKFNDKGNEIRYTCDNEQELILVNILNPSILL